LANSNLSNLSNLSIGVDDGGSKVLGGVVDDSGKILKTLRKETPKSGGADLNKVVAEVVLELHREFSTTGVCITAPGFVSSDRQTVLGVPNIVDWDQRNLHSELKELTGLDCVIENDANAAAWGEAKYGAGKGISHSIILTIGTGIGGGVVMNGSLYRGANGCAAEFGHMRIVPDGELCGCGAKGCFERYASGSALMRHTEKAISADHVEVKVLLALGDGTLAGLKGEHITAAAQDGNKVALKALATTGSYIGQAISSLSVLFDPKVVVIGGGVIDAGDLLLGPARTAMEATMPFLGKHPLPQIVAAKMGNEAGLVGAADLARL